MNLTIVCLRRRGQRCNAADSDAEQAGTRASGAGRVPHRGALAHRAGAASRVVGTLVEPGRRPHPGGHRSLRQPVRDAVDPQHVWPGRDQRTRVLRTHRPQRARVRDVPSTRRRHERVGGHHRGAVARDERTDPIFAAIDGSNCPSLPQDDAASHSLLLKRGLFRVPLTWPPRRADGTPVEPEFTIEVVRDPTGCNTHPEYGLTSRSPTVSVYRRPRPVANLKYVVADDFGVGPFIAKNGQPAARDPAEREAAPDEHDGGCARDDAGGAGGVGGPGPPPDGFRAERGAAAADRGLRTAGVCRTEPSPGRGRSDRARRAPGARAGGTGRGPGRRARQQHDQLRLPHGRGLEGAAAQQRWRRRRTEPLPRVGGTRSRRVLLPHVLDQGRHAPEHGGARQPGQADVRHLPRHAHDGDGYGQRLDGHRHHQSALGKRATAEPMVHRQARDAALQADLPHRARAAPIPWPRHLHPGPRARARSPASATTSARSWSSSSGGWPRERPTSPTARPGRSASWSISTTAASTSSWSETERQDLVNFLSTL